jgi:hypothetical protein
VVYSVINNERRRCEKLAQKDIFTILYEVGKQKYLIGVTNEETPTIASLGINTSRPLPQNIRKAVVETVMELKGMRQEPQLVDYNAPSHKFSKAVLGDFSKNPLDGTEQPAKTIAEAIAELKMKMMNKN